jgi:hypothetical protein
MQRKTSVPFSVFLLLYIVLSILLFDPKLFTGGDNAVYIILAESIAKGSGYKNIYIPEQTPHTQYPFGFPLLLSLFVLIFGTNVIALKFLIFMMGVCSFYFFYRIAEHLFKENTRYIIPFFVSIPIFIIYNHWILSEIPFLCFSLGSLFFLLKTQDNKKIYYYLAFFFGIYSFFIRTAGISLIITIVFFLILKRQYKYLGIFVLIFLAVFIPWQIRNSNISEGGSYIDQLLAKNPYQMELGKIGFSDLIARIWENFIYYSFTILPQTLLPIIKANVLISIIGLLFVFLSVVGFIKKIRCISIIELYFVFSLIVLLAWPKVWSSERFLLPVLPIFIFYIFSGLFWLAAKIKLKNFVLVLVIIFIFLNTLEIISQAKIAIGNHFSYLKGDKYAGYPMDWRRYFETIEWIYKNIPQNKIIMARKPEFVYLLSRRKSFCYPFTTNAQEIEQAIQKADYILFDNFQWTGTTYRYLLPVIQQKPAKYEIVNRTKSPEFFVLRVLN